MRLRKSLYFLGVLLLLLLAACNKQEVKTPEMAALGTATIASDKADYTPGETVTLTGTGWAASEAVHIFVNDDVGEVWSHNSDPDPVADASGAFTYQFQLPTQFVADYVVRATGATSGTATTTFTDDDLSWDQCMNDNNPNDNKQDPCGWTNGALNTNNSIYAEGDVVPQRHIRGTVAGAHYTIFDHSFYDQAKDAYTYDFWATPDFTVQSNLNPCADLANSLGLSAAQCNALFAAKQVVPIPTESTYTIGSTTYTYPFVAGAEANGAADGVTRNLWISCGTVGGTKQAPTFTTGTCTGIGITILGHGDGNKNLLPGSAQQGPPTADEYVQMKVSYTTPNNTFVAIWVGGHLAKNSYWNDPTKITNSAFLGNGSSSAAGASFHQRLNGWDLNSAIGNRDNQIQNSGGTVVPPGTITIIKDDTTNSGTNFSFTASPAPLAAFSLSDNGSGGNTKVFTDVLTGTYTVNEGTLSGWKLDNVVCSSTAGTSTTTVSATGASIKLEPGDNVTCTFKNSPQNGTLTLLKTVINNNGGKALDADFTLTATKASTTLSGTEGQPAITNASVEAGTYTLSESGPAGYTGSAWTCKEGTNSVTVTNNQITLAPGKNYTCEITNDDNPLVFESKLVVKKHVVNDNGGTKVASDFTVSVSGNGSAPGSETGTEYTLTNGTYAISESTVAGYTQTGFNCDNGNTDPNNVVLSGGVVTCTITNTDQPAHLKLVKEVINDNGGGAAVTDFTLSAAGPTPISGAGGAESDVKAGKYDLSETDLPGYTPGSWSCVGGTQSGASVTLALGESATCTITNDDQQAYVIVEKIVVNDNGGTANPDDFNLTLDGNAASSGTQVPVNPGTHTVAEIQLAGYSFEGFSADCNQNGEVTVALGETKKCTLTNNDIQPKLTVTKVVINDNGGTKVVSDFPLNVSGTAVNSGETNGFNAGGYTVGEANLPGYGATITGDCAPDGTVTLNPGDNKTCTITNDDIAPSLTLVKKVNNDSGGSAEASAFTLTATGPSSLSGAGGAASDATFQAGTYTLSETNVSGYTASAWECVGDGTQNGDQIALEPGQSAICTITNDDQPAHLILVKEVINDNGGTAVAGDFILSASGPTPISGAGGADSDVNAGTYTLSESGPGGYSTAGYDCGASVTLALDETKTCKIVNDDIQPKLTVIKVVVNDNGGTKQISDFPLNVSGTSVTSGITNGFNVGSYVVGETNQPGYTATITGDCDANGNVSLNLGDNKTCTITNNDVKPKLTLVKTVVNNNGGTKTVADFKLFVNGSGVTSGATNEFNAGTYTASETNLYGYTAGAWGGDCAANGLVTLSVGDNKTCTITNDDQPGKIIIKKITKPVGSTLTFNFTTTGSGYAGFGVKSGEFNSQTLNAGTYTVKELVPTGWTLTAIGGSSDPNTPNTCVVTGSGGSTGVGDAEKTTATIELKNGDTVECVFENTGGTRTQGFWATHSKLANIAWFGGTGYGHTFGGVASVPGIGDNLICGRPVDALGKLMGGFWSDVAKTSTGAKRSTLEQARAQLLQQLLAAELNASAFAVAPTTGSFGAWETALCGTDTNAIKSAQSQAASFNSAGDSSAFTPGTAADSKTGRAIATLSFWDLIKP